jgi:hypothetical protein
MSVHTPRLLVAYHPNPSIQNPRTSLKLAADPADLAPAEWIPGG